MSSPLPQKDARPCPLAFPWQPRMLCSSSQITPPGPSASSVPSAPLLSPQDTYSATLISFRTEPTGSRASVGSDLVGCASCPPVTRVPASVATWLPHPHPHVSLPGFMGDRDRKPAGYLLRSSGHGGRHETSGRGVKSTGTPALFFLLMGDTQP